MSEYQYYEFQAIDRPLTAQEQATLRKYSSRATITSSRFAVDYSWGDFKGNAAEWMEKYFDAFLYLANWGTRSPASTTRPSCCSTISATSASAPVGRTRPRSASPNCALSTRRSRASWIDSGRPRCCEWRADDGGAAGFARE